MQPTMRPLLDHPQMSSPVNFMHEMSSPRREGVCVEDPTSSNDMV